MGQKQKMEKKEEERLNDGNKNGQLSIATPPWVAHAKPPRPKLQFYGQFSSHPENVSVKLLTSAVLRSLFSPGFWVERKLAV